MFGSTNSQTEMSYDVLGASSGKATTCSDVSYR